MEGVERGGKWKILRERLSFKGITCCGGGFRPSSNMIIRDDEEGEDQQVVVELNFQGETMGRSTTDHDDRETPPQACLGQIPAAAAASGMNLATALAAERQFRAQNEWEVMGRDDQAPGLTTSSPTVTATVTTASTGTGASPLRVSLMALLEEGEGEGEQKENRGGGSDGVCCVCMGRRKGAAFIPCGHTFCRVCSRELWLNRGSCPLCNRAILEILDIF